MLLFLKEPMVVGTMAEYEDKQNCILLGGEMVRGRCVVDPTKTMEVVEEVTERFYGLAWSDAYNIEDEEGREKLFEYAEEERIDYRKPHEIHEELENTLKDEETLERLKEMKR